VEATITKKVSLQYLLFLPDGYSKDDDKQWPLILFLHGAGERGDDLARVKVHGPPKIVESRRDFPFIVVSPQCPRGSWWSNDELIVLLDSVIEKHAVDADRVYLTGLSMGGFGTWSLAGHAPERFAAIAPICGGGSVIDIRGLRRMPVWAFHGARDRTVPVAESTRLVEALQARGNDRAKITVYPEAGHDSWTESYNNEELYRWFLSHRRERQRRRPPAPEQDELPWPPVATFSILGYDPETGEVGGAVQSRVFSVGNGVLWAEADVGAVATQAVVDVSYGPQALKLLAEGIAPSNVIEQVLAADPDPRPTRWAKTGRQFAVMDAEGRVAAHTGETASDWAGHVTGQYFTAQGNILAGEEVVNAMGAAFTRTEGHLSLRLLAALEAGQEAGGDRRGMQSAAMLIVKKDGGVWLNNDVVLRLQVDDHEQPIAELRRLVERAARRFRRR
jgi:uncharacterized Ntn-hydrolase superfamily protein/predicted esterase